MSSRLIVQPVLDFLSGETSSLWFSTATLNISCLLIDHANCEKKAASAALGLIYKYIEHETMLQKLSRLAREELRHFEMVLSLMSSQGVDYEFVSASGYANNLRKSVRTHEPSRLIDLLICGAIVEARSCERFYGLSKVLPVEISELYAKLLQSEARHFEDYLEMASNFSSNQELDDRVGLFLECEYKLIMTADPNFRFHSGLPS